MHITSSVVHAHSQRTRSQPEPGSAHLCEVAQVHGWRIRRCDAFNLLLLDALNQDDPSPRDHVIVCTPREYRMLVPLLEQMGRPVPFAALIDGPFEIGRDRDLFRTHMARVRKKIAHLGIVIRPVKGYGYIAQIEDKATGRTI